MIAFKDCVKVPRTVLILAGVTNAATVVGLPSITVTSGNDSQHMVHSKHYTDEALDFRTHDVPGVGADRLALVDKWAATVRTRLGAGYVVLIEDRDTPNEHMHVGYGSAV